MSKPNFTIGITGLNASDSPGPGVGVIRAIRESPDFTARIIGLSYESLEPGIYMHDIVDKTYQIPYPSAGTAPLISRLEYIHQQENLDIVIPNFDAELANFIKMSSRLKKWGINSLLPSLEQLEMIDKMHLHKFGESDDFQVPKTIILNSKAQINDLKNEIDFPFVVKGRYYEAYIAYNEHETNLYFDRLNAKWGLPVIVQELVQGTEIDIAGLGNGAGVLIGAVPMRKLYLTDKGKGWSGVVLEDDALISLAEKFCKASNWPGGFELELMRTNKNVFYLMEVNPRFPAWIYTTAAAGQNLPAAAVMLAMGIPVHPYLGYKPGTMFIRYSWDLITNINEFEKISTLGEL
jgi:carbamoyl-phosphate synthase large subunit